MRALWVLVAVVLGVPVAAQTREDPRAISIHPFTGQRGATFTATVRGSGLAGATAAVVGLAPFTLTVEGVEGEEGDVDRGVSQATLSDSWRLRG